MIAIDFETYSATDLNKHGFARYLADPTFRPLIASVVSETTTRTFDFVLDKDARVKLIKVLSGHADIVAHNVSFEKGILGHLGLRVDRFNWVDSAVISRVHGGGSSLEAASRQLLGSSKLDVGRNLINLFSIPSKKQVADGDLQFDHNLPVKHSKEWDDFRHYCTVDAQLSFKLARAFGLTTEEASYNEITSRMNEAGWTVDVDLVRAMKQQYEKNLSESLRYFRDTTGAHDLNFNSLKQMKEWCADRGVKATSFDEKHVASMIKKIEAKLAFLRPSPRAGSKSAYMEVLLLLKTKQQLGGASLKKLDTILNTVTSEGKLVDQYVHCGAGQTLRTTARGVQVQNLKRLTNRVEIDKVVDELGNEQLAENLRQVFISAHPHGQLIVADFASIESRGLAWCAKDMEKLTRFRQGLDMYMAQAAKMFNVNYGDVTPEQRRSGKVAELSCGYGAGADAVRSFAEGMDIHMTEAESAQLVREWRNSNPKILRLWECLDDLIDEALQGRRGVLALSDGYSLVVDTKTLIDSLPLHARRTLTVTMFSGASQDSAVFTRYFHGVYQSPRGNLRYHKPSRLKSGSPWKDGYINPKTGQFKHYELYGGKLAGIITQSLCREIFFMALKNVTGFVDRHESLSLIGQFHDEAVIDWVPMLSSGFTKPPVKLIRSEMQTAGSYFPSLPIVADVHADYRYIK